MPINYKEYHPKWKLISKRAGLAAGGEFMTVSPVQKPN
jgi:hypothetical protein